MTELSQDEQRRRTDERARKNLPPGAKLLRTLRGHTDYIYRIAWSADGRMLASPSADKTIRLWDAETGTRLRTLKGHRGEVNCVVFDPKLGSLASGSDDGTIRQWDPHTGKLVRTLRVHGGVVLSVAINSAGRILASGGGQDATIRLWDAETGELLRTLEGHRGLVKCVSFDLTGDILASGSDDKTIRLWDAKTGKCQHTLEGHQSWVNGVDFDPVGSLLASASDDITVKLWNPVSGKLLGTLEGHTSAVKAVSFHCGGQVLATRSNDDSIQLWNCSDWRPVAKIHELANAPLMAVPFHPTRPVLATAGVGATLTHRQDNAVQVLRLYELDLAALLSQPSAPPVTYTSAKVVLVGDSGSGKTGLGWRLAHGEFKEHASTHGQQFWLLNQLSKQRHDGAQCEAILWDLAGQDDYRIIHSLFLDDADLALVLFDPTRHDDPLSAVEFWLKQLKVGVGDTAGTPTVLIAGRADRGTPRFSQEELEEFCQQHGIEGYLATSAKAGEGINELIEKMQGIIPWDEKPATVTTETFKRIKDFVLNLKADGRARKLILTPVELRNRLAATDRGWKFSDDEMLTAVGHLATHGYVTRLETSLGEPRILLAPELLNNLAASFVLEARKNRKGLGSLEEERLLSGDYKFPELGELAEAEKDILIDSATVLFLEHSVCFRETDPLNGRAYLVFPELINLKRPLVENDGPIEDGMAYTVSGSVENVYASLVVLMGYTQTFTRTNQWRNQARYEVGQGHVCGLRQEEERAGELDFVLYFSA